jgi:hypothetical protein
MSNWKLIIAALALSGAAQAGYEDVGLGARPLGLGGAFAALADDANGIAWNPAGLVQMKRQEALFMHGVYGGLSAINYDYLAYVYPMAYSAVGVGWSTVGVTLEEGDGLSYSSSRMSEDMYYVALGINPALFGNDSLTVGATLKRLTIDNRFEGGSGMGFDFGALFRPVQWGQVALVLRNVATDIRNEKLPTTFRLGFASRLFSDRVRLVADFTTKDNIGTADNTQYKPHLGLELQPWKFFALRGGVDEGRLAFGVGANVSSFKLDYGYQAQEIVGGIHRLSMGVNFGPDGTTYVRPEGEKAAPTLLPPGGLKGGFFDGRVMIFWDASPTKGVAGYNVYLQAGKKDWVKVNESLIWEDKRAATVAGERGETYRFAVTAVGLDKSESDKSETVEIIAR